MKTPERPLDGPGRRARIAAAMAVTAVFVLLEVASGIGWAPTVIAWAATVICGLWYDRQLRQVSKETGRDDPGIVPLPSHAALVDALPGAVVLLAPDDTIAAFNDRARELWPNLQIGGPILSATRQPDLIAAMRQARSSGQTQQVRYEQRVPVERHIETAIAAFKSPADGATHLLLALRDLTEEARIEQMRADFVANASHELRTPLASLQGFIETLQGSARNDAVARERFLSVMASQATRMTRLIDDLMSLSKIEMREHVTPSGIADLGKIATSIAQALEPLAREAHVSLEVGPLVSPVLVRGDTQELEQVAQNLIQNAIKYGRPDGHVRISVAAPTAGERQATLTVADDGPGIAAAHLPRLTERFYRVDVPESRNRGGTGLGLAIVKHILNRHRGELLIRSEVGKGSIFTVVLPAI